MRRLLLLAVLLSGCLHQSTLPDEAVDAGGMRLELVAEGLTAPVGAVSPDDGSGRLFIVEQTGTIRILTSEGELLDEPFLDISGRLAGLNPAYDERGLLGLAFHPGFRQNGKFYVYYSAPLGDGAPEGWDHTSHLSEFRLSSMDAADPSSERIVLSVDQPQSNHNGGHIAFGPDGYLYIPLGDGGNANDVGTGHPDIGNGQDKSTLLGSILRIDVDEDPYGIPPDNPFVGRDGCDEIFAYGFRNPYHISFDSGSGRLFAADVGQNRWEELDIVENGGNYGWNIKEGAHCFDPDNPSSDPAGCPSTGAGGEPLVDPILEYRNSNTGDGIGLAVVGGAFYRGAMDDLQETFVFGDWSTSGFVEGDGVLLAAEDSGGSWTLRQLPIGEQEDGTLGSFLLAIGEGPENELYVLTSDSTGPAGASGKVHRIT